MTKLGTYLKKTVRFITPEPGIRLIRKLRAKAQRPNPFLCLGSSVPFPVFGEKGSAFPLTKDHLSAYLLNPENQALVTFPRVCRTICSSDADYIPKVEDAGKIVEMEGKKVQIMHQGIKIYQHSYSEDPERFDPSVTGTWTSDIIRLLRGHHEPQEEKAFYEILKDIPAGGSMLELGCWWAYYSMWFNKAVPGAKNFMIEPNKKNLDFGKANFKLNGMQGDFTYGFLGEKIDDSIIGVDSNTPSISIDAFMQEKNLEFIDLLHSDIQGGEYKMLLEAANTLKAHKARYIFISTHGPKTHERCLETLKEYNYHIVCAHTVEEGCSGDGLIVARAKSHPGIDHIEITKYNYDWSKWRILGAE